MNEYNHLKKIIIPMLLACLMLPATMSVVFADNMPDNSEEKAQQEEQPTPTNDEEQPQQEPPTLTNDEELLQQQEEQQPQTNNENEIVLDEAQQNDVVNEINNINPPSLQEENLIVQNQIQAIEEIEEEEQDLETLSFGMRTDYGLVGIRHYIEKDYDFYYKTTSGDDTENKPVLDSTDLSGWTKCTNYDYIYAEEGKPIYIQMIKVNQTDNKIKAWGQKVATPLIISEDYTVNENKIMAYKFTSNGFDIRGNFADRWKRTTFADRGYYTYFKKEASDIVLVHANGTEENVDGVNGISVKTNLDFVNDGKQIKVKYTVKNTGEESVTYSLGSCGGIVIGNDQSAAITKFHDIKGFKMISSNEYDKNQREEYAQFNFFGSGTSEVTDVDAYWYGNFQTLLDKGSEITFYDESQCEDGDKESLRLMAYSWQDRTIAPGKTQEYSVLIGVGGKGSEDEVKKNNNNTNSSRDRSDRSDSTSTNQDITYVYNPNNTVDSRQATENINKAVDEAIQNANELQKNEAKAEVTLKNINVVRPSIFSDMARAFNNNIEKNDTDNIKMSALFDSTSKTGKILARLYVDIEQASNIKKDINTLIFNDKTYTKNIKAVNTFKKYFDNNVTAITFGQEGSFDMNVRVAAKVDVNHMDKNNLYIYSYNPSTNTYKLISNSDYYFDANDYLHFNTNTGDQIIITDKQLISK